MLKSRPDHLRMAFYHATDMETNHCQSDINFLGIINDNLTVFVYQLINRRLHGEEIRSVFTLLHYFPGCFQLNSINRELRFRIKFLHTLRICQFFLINKGNKLII